MKTCKLADLSKTLSVEEIHKLTEIRRNEFKILFSSQMEPAYTICSIEKVNHPSSAFWKTPRIMKQKEKLEMFLALATFIDECTQMTYSEVDAKYARENDKFDKKKDMDGEFPVTHYQLSKSGLGSQARIHGYVKDGYFVVIRMDWGHNFHKLKNKGRKRSSHPVFL